MIILSIDHGTKNIGLAISDELEIASRPLPQIRTKPDASEIKKVVEICQRYSVDKILIGLPSSPKTNNSNQSAIVKEFAKNLSLKTNIPIIFWDETYSTKEAKTKTKTKKTLDSYAAHIILQEYLNSPDKILTNTSFEN